MHQILFWYFQKGITPETEITRTRKKMCVKYFSMRNPYMKFQNPSITVLDEWTDGHTHNPKPICPVNFYEVGGMMRGGAIVQIASGFQVSRCSIEKKIFIKHAYEFWMVTIKVGILQIFNWRASVLRCNIEQYPVDSSLVLCRTICTRSCTQQFSTIYNKTFLGWIFYGWTGTIKC